jgi:SHS2 domain-containing protein
MAYRFLPHTADTIFEAEGKSMEEAYAEAALAMQEVMTDTSKVKPKLSRKIRVEGEDLKALLYQFLERLLILHDSENLLFSKFGVGKIAKTGKGFLLEGEAWGEKFDPKRHESRTLVKAVTYHEMSIGEKKGNKYVRVLVDI